MANTRAFDLIENYIYIYQLDKYVIIPSFPESLTDSLGSTFATTNILARTAPIYSYSYSGPRQVTVGLDLHRDMMYDVNRKNSDFLSESELTDDYIDTLIRYLQAMALPSYAAKDAASKMVNPPMVAVRFGNTLFIKGIIQGNVQVEYSGPLTRDKKYQQVRVSFNVVEVDPQDAESIANWGSFRGLESVLTRNMKK